jgi:natural product biosynthesis luciferase-like monooxygenase protein
MPDVAPECAEPPIAIELVDALGEEASLGGAKLRVAITRDGRRTRWTFAADALDARAVASMQRGLQALIAAASVAPDTPLGAIDILTAEERDAIVRRWNPPSIPAPAGDCVHRQFVAQAARTPDRAAVTCHGVTLDYAELDRRSNRLAAYLAGRGVRPGVLVGLHLERSVDMLVALIAIHKAGGAYVALDPAYPDDRLAYIVEDARMPVVVTHSRLPAPWSAEAIDVVRLDRDAAAIDARADAPVDGGADAADLAYAIYTSGSTGRPKGVAVEHRNVANFFAGMDDHLPADGCWLAVTSLSFDISVLELCWTVARGLHVVIATGEETKGSAAPVAATPIDFSLYYFASADTGTASDHYRLLMEGARFADAHGFAAVWTPERHFHAFGGPYPNPAVTAAALAASTSRVAIRAGSVVAPLHHPARIAEEWALVDNLSGGRVGIAFASGWQPNDFVLRPESYADRPRVFAETVETVRALWRGERRAFPGPMGAEVEIATYPRPVQPELPVWITSAGNIETFANAGRLGANILTHLLGQDIEELARKLDAYREARRAAGHEGPGHVTLMLHSFVGDDRDAVREIVRRPLIDYLRVSTDLVRQYAWSFPAFARRAGADDRALDLHDLAGEEMDALLEHAFDRYYGESGLFGTPEDCLPLIGRLRGIGIDEIACLIDFGVPTQTALDHLPALDRLRRLANPASVAQPAETLPELMARHGVTHLQCTPSFAQMLVADEAMRPGLARLDRMLVGGEALPPGLARDLTGLVGGTLLNMYGPTETTVWSSVHAVEGDGQAVPIGRPLANQQIYICDTAGRLLPPGVPGELVIAGAGVVRGYLDRPELTAERFVAHPVDPAARAYRTGDLARQRDDGTLEYLGRMDHQVKIRGHRIEIGEIEAVLASHPSVAQTVVAVREDTPGDVRLVAYVIASAAPEPRAEALRDHLRRHLPEFMVPAHFVALDSFPRTPNGKLDRVAVARAAPTPPSVGGDADGGRAYVAPEDDAARTVASLWARLLGLPRVGMDDNFFDLGGHSLLAVQMHRELRGAFDRPLLITDVFRFPTVRALSAFLDGAQPTGGSSVGATRADLRRAALRRRAGAQAVIGA